MCGDDGFIDYCDPDDYRARAWSELEYGFGLIPRGQ